MMIKPIYIVNIAFIMLIIALLFSPLRNLLQKIQLTSAVSQISTAKIISSEDYNIDLKGINVEDMNFSSFKGKKIFLNFWGTWCPACNREMPEIQKLYNAKKNNYQFVLIYMKDKRDEVEKYLRKHHYTFPVYEAVSPIKSYLLPKVFPTTLLIDEKGNIVDRIEGAEDWSKLIF